LADYSTLFIEGGFIVCIFSLAASRFIASAAVIFHVFVLYSMRILFINNLVAYACLIDFRRFLRNGRVRHLVSRFGRLARRIRFLDLFVLAFAVWGLRLVLDVPGEVFMDIALVIAVVSMIYSIAALADRLIFGHAFPLGANHLLFILYDGECGLCDKWVQFVLRHDHRRIFRFAPLQSQTGKDLLRDAGKPESDLSSMVLIIDRKAYFRSTGALMILRQLGGFRSLLGIFGFIPAGLRDAIYSLVAANRHRWFPKASDSCQLPQYR
jgi:predicted DCC family thiol-disulfide oxidoreductase YuxK